MFHGRSNKILFAFAIVTGVLFMGACEAMNQRIDREGTAMEAVRISPQEAYREVTSGRALLVCAYPSEETCRKIMLQGAMSLKEFESRLTKLKKDQAIIFYCA